MMDQPEIKDRWQRLDPIFIMGMRRTGTSIVWQALQPLKFLGFPEGHLWFELVEPFARFRDLEHEKFVRQDTFVLGSGRNLMLEKRFALMIDQFHRNLLPSDLARWMDKSPGLYPITVAPMLAELFPRSQFIFMKRNAITVVNSTIAQFPHIFQVTCEQWVGVMNAWRQVRHLLTGRYVEVAQEHIAEEPEQVATQVTEFLGIPQFAEAVADVFKSRRENTSFPDKDVGDFFYPVKWTDEQKKMLTDICGEEMAIWGYPLDFQHPGGPDPTHAVGSDLEPMDMAAYYRWLRRQDDYVLDYVLDLEQTLEDIRHGRVMRILNKVEKVLQRLGLRESQAKRRH